MSPHIGPDASFMPNFQRALALADCPVGSSREVVVGERIVALYNVDGAIHALDGVCPHQGGPLGKGCLQGAIVTCPWHGWQFDVRTGQHQFSASVVQPRFEVRIEGDSILVDIEPEPGSMTTP